MLLAAAAAANRGLLPGSSFAFATPIISEHTVEQQRTNEDEDTDAGLLFETRLS